MQFFKDNQNREWEININVGTAKRIKAACGIDVFSLFADEGSSLQELSQDFVMLVDTLWIICSKQAEARGISEEQFAEGLTGDVIADATNSFLLDIVNFFPEKKKKVLLQVLEKTQKAAETQEEIMINQLQSQLDSGAIDKEIERLLQKSYGKESTTLLDTAE